MGSQPILDIGTFSSILQYCAAHANEIRLLTPGLSYTNLLLKCAGGLGHVEISDGSGLMFQTVWVLKGWGSGRKGCTEAMGGAGCSLPE